jgi:hypothetical protein
MKRLCWIALLPLGVWSAACDLAPVGPAPLEATRAPQATAHLPDAVTPTVTVSVPLVINAPLVELPTTWNFDRVVVGSVAEPPYPLGTVLMAEVWPKPSGGYRLFFNHSTAPGQDAVGYADSADAATWTYLGDVLSGSADPASPFYIFGGARVVPAMGGYRMYLRASPQVPQGQPPKYQIYSAFSSDGLSFTMESGVRIPINTTDPTSPFSLAGHGAFYVLPDGRYAAFISADPVGQPGPSDLYWAVSNDGVTWGGYTLMYPDYHDPVVIKRNGQYYLVANWLAQGAFYGASADGVTWPAPSGLQYLNFYDAQGVDVSDDVGDIGAMIAPNGQDLWLLSNWGRQQQPGAMSSAIALFKPR